MEKFWNGNKYSVLSVLGARNIAKEEREVHDYYATPPEAVEMLLELESFQSPILEPACGEGHISRVLLEHGFEVISSDLINRGFGEVKDFYTYKEWHGDIITNPPYKYARQFVEHSLEIMDTGRKLAMFLKVLFLEGKTRRKLFEKYPPKTVWVSSSRIICGKNGIFDKKMSSAIAHAWFIWIKGYKGDTIIKWFN